MKAGISVLSAAICLIGGCLIGPTGASASAPSIDHQWVTGVTSNNATLNAEIHPNGAQTYYELQIDTTGNFKFAQNTSCPIDIAPMFCLQVIMPGDPLPPGLVQPPEFVLAAGDEPRQVSVNMAGIGATLQPGTTYHYRVIATHAFGPVVYGPDQTFSTPAATGPPTIDDQWVTDITANDATLHALINPNGLLTKYKLQLDTTGSFSFYQTSSCPLLPPGIGCAAVVVPGDPLPAGLVQPPEFTLPAAYGGQQVSVNMASIGATLQPGTTYHFRAIAANSPHLVEGADLTFTTPSALPLPEEPPEGDEVPEDEPPLGGEVPGGADELDEASGDPGSGSGAPMPFGASGALSRMNDGMADRPTALPRPSLSRATRCARRGKARAQAFPHHSNSPRLSTRRRPPRKGCARAGRTQ